jgi:hypothetical protein
MATFEDVLRLARTLSAADQQRLIQALAAPAARRTELPLTQFGGPTTPRAHTIEWVKAERGHAVLATETGDTEAEIPAGPEAIAGMWADRQPPAEEEGT